MIARANADSIVGTTATAYHDGDGGTATTSGGCSMIIYSIFQHIEASCQSDFVDDCFSWHWIKDILRLQVVRLNRAFSECIYKLRIFTAFNVYGAVLCRRMMFPKSGFLARAGRRKKN